MVLAHPRLLPALAVALAACGGGSPEPAAPTANPAPVEMPKDRMAGQKVYDARGNEQSCAPPDRSCTPEEAPLAFRDECRLAGFRLMQCGCAMVCTGRPGGGKVAFDAQNSEKPCPPEQKDCSPPDTSAAFQDACTESGHKFKVCGCTWLCSGKLKQPVSTSPPAP